MHNSKGAPLEKNSPIAPPPKPAPQKFDYLVVLDFEATCDKEDKKWFTQEIIEWPSCLVDTKTLKIVDEFSTYVQPSKHPYLSGFCIGLTGITQKMVDTAPPFKEVLQKYEVWLTKNGLLVNGDNANCPSFAMVIWGNWDLQEMLPTQCKREGVKLPVYFHNWIDLRDVFEKKYQANGARTVNRDGLRGAFRELGLTWTGRLHSGLDDTRNTVKVATRMMEDQVVFAHTDYVFAKNL